MLSAMSIRNYRNYTSEAKTVVAWLINLRWLAIASQLICLIPGVKLGLVLAEDVTSYLLIVFVLCLFNLLTSVCVRKNILSFVYKNLCQLMVDLLAITLLLSLSVAKDNPMIALFYLHTAIGAMLLRGWQSGVFLICLHVGMTYVLFRGYPFSQAAESRVLSTNVKLIAQLFLVTIIWLLMSSLSQQLSALRERLSKLAKNQSRIENLRVLGASTASFSHLFATPLNTIKLRVNRLIKDGSQFPSSSNGDLESLRHAVDQCEKVLRSFFEVAHSDDRSLLRSVDICEYLQAVCSEWCVGKDNVSLDINIDSKFPEHVRCQIPELAFSRNVIDILDNAIEASQSNQIEIRVRIRLNQHMVEIEISDNGPGIPSSVIRSFGNPFITTKADGSGLGLFTVLSMAQALGGDLRIRDGADRGASILLTIPSCPSSRSSIDD
ncbi:MAG: HAMP domain-containing histidine kinase [Deltaproteobacteria bacterium]|nr:HAMP domain-containing histidine kinase [Deltaproteobacteria bacterium]